MSGRNSVARLVATWFGCGLIPKAPGTMGALSAIPLYLAVRPAGSWAVALAAFAVTIAGLWSSAIMARKLNEPDPSIVCIDEVAGMLITYLGAPPGWAWTALGFVLFRLLDVLKPWPARAAERRLRGGYGIMLDDVVAGAWGAALLALLGRVAGA